MSDIHAALADSLQIAQRLHRLASDVTAYTGGSWTAWDELDEDDRYHYIGAGDIIAAHLATHGTDHLDWLAQRVHEVRGSNLRDPHWEDLDDEERQLTYDMTLLMVQGEDNG